MPDHPTPLADRWAPELRSVLRIMTALVFLNAGAMKIFAFPHGMPPDGGTASFPSQIWVGGVLELVGGALLLVGLFTRPAAFLMSGMMAVAYFQFHFPAGFWPSANGGVAAITCCFIWLYISAAGPGPWSVDARLRSR
jgi:putative oxidoreductase